MAKIIEEIVVVKISRIAPDRLDVEPIMDASILDKIEQGVQNALPESLAGCVIEASELPEE